MIRLEVFDKSLILGANFYQLYGGSCYEKLHVGHSEVGVSIFSFGTRDLFPVCKYLMRTFNLSCGMNGTISGMGSASI